jgi:TPR repeat protein
MKLKRSLFLPFLLSIVSSASFAQSSQLNDLLDAATHGNAEAQFNLGRMYDRGGPTCLNN